ncbi:unnamed protein product, partial [Mesorhabditis spiculigera]
MFRWRRFSTNLFLVTAAVGAFIFTVRQIEHRFSKPVHHGYHSEHPKFRKPDYVSHIDCRRLFEKDEKYLESLLYTNKLIKRSLDNKLLPRIVAKEEPFEDSCRKLRDRIIGDHPAPYLNYSIAFARNIYADYESLQILLSATYSPENHYCYHVDVKATQKFKDQIAKLEQCFPNIYVTKEQYNVTSDGKNNNIAHLKCMEILLEKPGWEHLILLQAHDLVAHTNSELMKMLKLLNGTNDSNLSGMLWNRVPPGLSFDVKDLNLWTNYTTLTFDERKNARLEFAKGLEEATYIRPAIQWLVKEINVTTLMDHFNNGHHSVDEQLFATFLNSETLRMPGGYHSACMKNRPDGFFTYITRHTRWSFEGHKNCNERHMICLYGIEDLEDARLTARRVISLNKFIGSFDFAAITCMAESLFNRTHGGDEYFDVEHIANHSGNRYQRATRLPGFDLKNFTSFVGGAAAQCPSNWTQISNLCVWYSGNTYRSWDDSQAYCKSVGGQLAGSYNKSILPQLQKLVTAPLYPAWTGLFRTNATASWKFIDKTSALYLAGQWAPGQPAAGTGNCGGVQTTGLAAISCKYVQPFLCSQKIATCPSKNYTTSTGTVTSPNYPLNYANNEHCRQYIVAPAGYYVTLTFNAWLVERNYDVVLIWDGYAPNVNAQLIANISVDPTNATVSQYKDGFQTYSNIMTIEFISDSIVNYKGWSASYKMLAPQVPVYQNGSSGTMTSPNYPGQYMNNLEQYYQAVAPDGMQICTSLSYFDTELNKDRLEMYDGPNSTYPLIGNFSGHSVALPSTRQTTGNVLTMFFYTDYSLVYKGFSMDWGVC